MSSSSQTRPDWTLLSRWGREAALGAAWLWALPQAVPALQEPVTLLGLVAVYIPAALLRPGSRRPAAASILAGAAVAFGAMAVLVPAGWEAWAILGRGAAIALFLYRGACFGRSKDADPAAAFRHGLLQVAVLSVAARGVPAVLLAAAFIFAGLLHIAVSGFQAGAEGERVPLADLMVSALVPLGAAALGWLVISPALLTKAGQVLRVVAGWAGWLIGMVLYVPFYLLFAVLRKFTGEAVDAPELLLPEPSPLEPTVLVPAGPPPTALKAVGIVLAVACVAALVIWVIRRFAGQRDEAAGPGLTERRRSLLEGSAARLLAAALLKALAPRPAHDRTPSGRIRRVYRDTFRLGRRAGMALTPATTPRELAGTMAGVLPEAAAGLTVICGLYQLARYSQHRVSLEQAEAVEAGWRSVRRASTAKIRTGPGRTRAPGGE